MKRFLMLTAVLAAASSIALADPACASGMNIIGLGGPITVTPGNTYSSTFSCQLGTNVFSNFSVVTNAGFPASSSFSLALSVNTNANTLDFGITLSAGEDVRLFYQISPGAGGMAMTVAGAGSTIIETVCDQAFTGVICGDTPLANFAVSSNQTGQAFFTPAATDFVFKDIQAGSGLSDFTQQIIPEPMTLSLMGAGLLGLGIFGRRRICK
jgi:hypothetical protein